MTITKAISRLEFVTLIASLTALNALSIDTMLPALGIMSVDLGLVTGDYRQLIITSLFIGFGLGLLGYGFVGDHLGRKKPIIFGVSIFLIGTIICTLANQLPVIILGRIIQGFGLAGPHVLCTAIVRDTYSGRNMAKILSLVMMIFMAVPALAPLIGQAILFLAGWKAIFVFLFIFGATALFWFILRLPESLPEERRSPLSMAQLGIALREILSHGNVMRSTLAQGLMFGAFLTFLSTSQQIFQEQYSQGAKFPFYFALLAMMLILSSFLNSRWVLHYGTHRLVRIALTLMLTNAVICLMVNIFASGHLPFSGFMIFMMVNYFCSGLLMGNFSSMALTPLGHMAGVASAVLGSVTTLIALALASLFGLVFNTTAFPLMVAYALLSSIALLLIRSIRRPEKIPVQGQTA